MIIRTFAIPFLNRTLDSYRHGAIAGISILVALTSVLAFQNASAQDDAYDPSWYNPGQTYVKVAVTEDGVYRITRDDLVQAGVSLSSISPSTLQMYENGKEIPILYRGNEASFRESSEIIFVGRQNRGDEEQWAYNYRDDFQSSTYYSLYTDTTYYWLTWDQETGLRYQTQSGSPAPDAPDTFQKTLHVETDRRFYTGDEVTSNPLYTRGEGFYWEFIRHRSERPEFFRTRVTLNGLAPDLSESDSVVVKVRLNSRTPTQNSVELRVATNGHSDPPTYASAAWNGRQLQTLSAKAPANLLNIDNRGRLRIELASFNPSNADLIFIDVDWVEVTYPRAFVATSDELHFPATTPVEQPQSFNLSGFTSNSVFVLNASDARAFVVNAIDGAVSFSDRPSSGTEYWAAGADALRAPAAIALDTPSDLGGSFQDIDYLIITTRSLRSSAQELAAYHQDTNNFSTKIILLQDIFDQFDYGRTTPIALRRFIHHTNADDAGPQYAVLWGDALDPDASRPLERWEVPSFGYGTVSDGWFAAQLDGPDDWTESLLIGRIPIRSNEQGILFVDKLSRYEAGRAEPWQKRMLMISSGLTQSEFNLLTSNLDRWGALASAAPTGLDTLRLYKNLNGDPFTLELYGSIKTAVDEGVSWLTYFGHSSSLEWALGAPNAEDYSNMDRLPFVLSLGCITGAFSASNPIRPLTLGEDYVIGSPNGAIAHVGTSGFSSVSYYARLGEEMHEAVFRDTVRVLGDAFAQAKNRVLATNPSIFPEVLVTGIIGDPATRLSLSATPEFRLTRDKVLVTPSVPTTADTSFTVTANLENLGLLPDSALTVHLSQGLPDGSVNLYEQTIQASALKEIVRFDVPLSEAAVGQNTLTITVDPNNDFDEEYEDDNIVSFTQAVATKSVSLVSPPELASVLADAAIFRLAFPAASSAEVVIELDTSPFFDSPDLVQKRLPATGTYASWQAPRLEPDRAHYWRASIDRGSGLEAWQESAFFTATNQTEGNRWVQAGELLVRATTDERLSYTDASWSFGAQPINVVAFSSVRSGNVAGPIVVDGVEYLFPPLGWGFGLVVISGGTGAVKAHGTTGRSTLDDTESTLATLDSLASVAQPGDYIVARTMNLSAWVGNEVQEPLRAFFRSLGASQIDTLTYDRPWVMFTRVGSPEITQEKIGPPLGNELTVEISANFSPEIRYVEGRALSPVIGPATSWDSLRWDVDLPSSGSQVSVDVLDARSGTVLLDSLTLPRDISLSPIDADATPFLQLRATLSDTTGQATPQLRSWSVDYASTPEVLVDETSLSLSADTLREGQQLDISGGILNLSDEATDTILVRLQLTDAQNRTTLVATDTLETLPPDSINTVSFTLSTLERLGTNRLTLEAEQPGLREPLTFNNAASTRFTVLGDETAPNLSVTLDGQRLPNTPDPVRDLQSPDIPQLPLQPTIEVTLSDTNPYKLLQDTSLVSLTLENVSEGTSRVLPFSSPDILFEPATEERNEARIVYTPDFRGKDAVYTFRVRAFDVDGNEAEGSPYQVHFRVQSTFAMGSLYPYPNPMSSFTRFAFELKGSDPGVVDDLRIRIYTLTGRVVREFDLVERSGLLEGGGLRIGWNKLPWDGTDEDGDPLASGVYLYKVFMRAEGQEIAVNNEAGLEKLVILR